MKQLLKICIVFLLWIPFLNAYAQDDSSDSPIGRCVNMGNMLEAPNEGEWGVRVEDDYMQTIVDAGFDSARIPIRWSAHAEETAPYTIDPDFMERIHEVVDMALEADLNAVINIHHYDEMMTEPDANFERLQGLWAQIAESFADYPETVLFELLNEPHNQLVANIWNEMYPQLINIIRETNPERLIIFGGDQWNSAFSLDNLILPVNTENLMVTFHFYEPFQFTHQGAEWVDGAYAWRGTRFGSEADYALINDTLDDVIAWRDAHNIPIFLGEWGSYSTANFDDRLLYTETVREAVESRGLGWCYWEFASGFGIYDPNTDEFNDLYTALIPEN
ncbi:MAG: glycoside hydrolase family 5 protein [Aggregatilineales bacterium]